MKSIFERKIATGLKMNWYLWSDMPAASVILSAEFLKAECFTEIVKILFADFEDISTEKRLNRAFLFLRPEDLKTGQKLIDYVLNEKKDYCLTVELQGLKQHAHQYDYLGLNEAYQNLKDHERFVILTLARSREAQAKILNVFKKA